MHESAERITSIRINPQKNVSRFSFLVNDHSLQNLPEISNGKQETRDEQIPWCPHGFYLSERPQFTLDPLLHAGAYYVQEASSMLLWQVLKQTVGNNKNCKVLDLCAAPGGKSTLLASYFKDGFIVSNEVIKQRVSVLYENTSKWGTANLVITNNDAKDFARLENYFDVILVDAPCSGSGLFRKDEEAVKEWSVDNVNLCSRRQQRIIADALPALKQDGVLIYSTCSYSKQEDEDVLDWLMENFQLETVDMDFPGEWQTEKCASEKCKAVGFRCWPNKLKGEGFFIAAFKKKDGGETNQRMPSFEKPAQKKLPIINNWINNNGNNFFMHKEDVHIAPSNFINDIALLQKNLYVKKAGINCGTFKGNDFIPHHELALSTLLQEKIQRIDFSKEDALAYLRKNDLPQIPAGKGWALASYNNLGLGWMKILPNRINNYYPVEWRILKQ